MENTINKTAQKPEWYLQKYFGFNTFKPLQKEIIQDTLSGNDTVVLMPTGGGKSVCYQLPSLMHEGVTLVVSPLIALMKDQVEAMRANGIPAAYINSTLSIEEKRQVKNQLDQGALKLLYVAPERLFTGNFIEYLKTLKIQLIAIDEAHCVSSWGHHFRPEYKKLSMLKDLFPSVPTMALTATVDKTVRSEIGELLHLKDPRFYIASFDRPNLTLSVLPGQKKWQQIQRIVNRHKGESGIIYCSSRKGTESLAAKLQEAGLNAKYYHAGLENGERSKVQEEFLQGETEVICATIAFGMGIDKPDIRFVIHHNMPGNLESYYQEIGRAGRDGKPAETILFYSYRDVQVQMGFIDEIEDQQYKQIQLTKLKRMQEYAEGQVCRRKTLLTYFSEVPEKDCGNCDVCKNPPEYFDGTTIAQMALSAIVRLNEKATISSLIEVLKGNYSDTVKANQFHTIKTFGKGSSITAFAWQMYIQQMLQHGIVEIDYKDHYTLKLTPESKQILYNQKPLRLVSPKVIKERQETQKQQAKQPTKREQAEETLFENLKELRKELAVKKGKPAFTVFSDATLQDMIDKTPATYEEFLEVEGVGEYKAEMYARPFLKAIADFISGNKHADTYKTTWALYNQGLTVDEIAEKRNIQSTTVYSHLAKLITDGYDIDIYNLVNSTEIDYLKKAVNELGMQDKLKPYFEFLKGEVEYGKIRLILSYLKKEN